MFPMALRAILGASRAAAPMARGASAMGRAAVPRATSGLAGASRKRGASILDELESVSKSAPRKASKKLPSESMAPDPNKFNSAREFFESVPENNRASVFGQSGILGRNKARQMWMDATGSRSGIRASSPSTTTVDVSDKMKSILSKDRKPTKREPFDPSKGGKPYTIKSDITVYHGGRSDFDPRQFTPDARRDAGTGGNRYGLSTSANKNVAKDFSTSSSESGKVTPLRIRKGAKVYRLDQGELDDLTEKEVQNLSKKYDVIQAFGGGEEEYRILNRKAIL